MILGSGLLQASGWTPTWLIRDEFTDTLAAGSVDGTAATPGPGTRTVTDTESKLSVGSGVLAIAGGKAVPHENEPMISYGPFTRSSGLGLITQTNGIASGRLYSGWATTHALVTAVESQLMIYLGRFAFNDTRLPFARADNLGEALFDTEYHFATILRSAGAFSFVKSSNEWVLLWASTSSNGSSLFAHIANFDGVFSSDYLRVTQLPAPFDSDTGLATDVHAGSVSAGTTFSHEADCLVEYTLTTRPSADNADVLFRVQDASNYWVSRVNSSGDISLVEVVAGTPTTRRTVAGVVSSGHRIVIIADDTTVRLYSNNTLRVTYASATSFATATAGELDALGTGGAVSDLITWPRTLSGTAAGILNKASA